MARLYASDEYYLGHGGTSASWLTSLYQKILGRGPDPQGLAGWIARLQQGMSRASSLSPSESLLPYVREEVASKTRETPSQPERACHRCAGRPYAREHGSVKTPETRLS